MKRFMEAIFKLLQGLSTAVLRFPWTVFCLLWATGLTCYMISLDKSPDLIIQKLMFVFLLGSFIGVTAQFASERFSHLGQLRWAVYVLAALVTGVYYLIIAPMPSIDYEVGARTLVAVFSMFCAFMWLPSFRDKFDFNCVALVHFKSAFTAILYAGVLTVGVASIIATVDILLFNVNDDYYGYMMAIVWILFATTYYLSLLPRFNSKAKSDQAYAREASSYPRFLEVLVSYIAIPLVAAYTLVLLAYFVKIAITKTWPSGQLGPMILAYSIAGLVIYVLASGLNNRVAVFYQRVFPKVLIPIVVMQLVSVYIRLQAYGITESRYYVALFGVFSIVIGMVLSFRPVKRNSLIAILAAGFAIISVLPPVDAFTMSRDSQINRLEKYLEQGGILVSGQLKPKEDVDLTIRVETTNILNYLQRRSYLEEVAWLPADFMVYKDMKETLGFEPTYPHAGDFKHVYVHLDMEKSLNIEGYDVMLQVSTYRAMDKKETVTHDLEVHGIPYQLRFEPVSTQDVRVSLHNAAGEKLVSTQLYEFAASAAEKSAPKGVLDADELTLDAKESAYKLRIIFQHIGLTSGDGDEAGADYNMYILIAVPPRQDTLVPGS